jgi:hypothetical protein
MQFVRSLLVSTKDHIATLVDRSVAGWVFAIMLGAFVFGGTQCHAQTKAETQSLGDARDFTFHDIFALRPGDHRVYVLLGSGFIRAPQSGDPGAFISDWLAAHPAAKITPISRMFTTNTRSLVTSEIVYIWIEDHEQSLNVDMIRAGIYPGATMYDMVDNEKGLDRLLEEDPKLADARAQIEKERAAAPQDRTERLVADDDYGERIRRIDAAESQARAEKLGIWSDAMKDERESEGLP